MDKKTDIIIKGPLTIDGDPNNEPHEDCELCGADISGWWATIYVDRTIALCRFCRHRAFQNGPYPRLITATHSGFYPKEIGAIFSDCGVILWHLEHPEQW